MLLDFIICKLLLHFRNNASYVWLFSCFSQTIATINRQHQDLEKCKKLLNFGSNCVKNLKMTLKKYFKICWQPCIHSKISSFIKITWRDQNQLEFNWNLVLDFIFLFVMLLQIWERTLHMSYQHRVQHKIHYTSLEEVYKKYFMTQFATVSYTQKCSKLLQ